MSLLAKSTLTAVAAAIAAAAVLTAAVLPAQAEYRRAPKEPTIKQVPKGSRRMYPARLLKCTKPHLTPFYVTNNTGQTLPIGKRINWRIYSYNGALVYSGTITLASPLPNGHSLMIPQPVPGKTICRASLFAW